jgi:nucleotide-binding universal stress UspA family protein
MTGNETPETRIVVGVDGSQQSRRALVWAARVAQATGAAVDAVIAWHYPVSYGWSYTTDGWNPENDARKCLEDAVDAVFVDGRPLRLNLDAREGLPAKVLLDASRHATLLVVGSRGHGGFAGLLLGSVSASCAEHAACPVLVVHGDEDPPPLI